MKRHITKEQLNSCPVFKEKLKHDIYHGDPIRSSDADATLAEQADIYMLIKYLNTENVIITSMKPKNIKVKKSYAEIAIKHYLDDSSIELETWFLKGFHKEELVDALFEAIKYNYK